MSDFTRKLEGAREHVAVEWTDEHARQVEAAMHARRRRRQVRARVLAIAAPVAVVLVGLLAWPRPSQHPVAALPAAAPARDRELRLDDGTTVTPRDDSSDVRVGQVAPDRVELALNAGAARLEVAGRDDRVVRVDARVARIETHGGVFTVELRGDGAHVSVEQGRVLVLWGIEETWLQGGESGDFPRAPSEATSASGAPAAAAVVPSASTAHVTSTPPPSAASTWRAQAKDGDYDGAFRSLQTAGATAVRDEPGDLLLAADAARLSRHASEAVAPLQRVVREHAGDPRAPLAAFTLGRVLLDELGRPAEAASAFAQARTLGAGGPLEEDALAREVEAWSRAGDAGKAHAAAEQYVSRYPDGRRLRAVRKFGELE